MGQIHQFRPPRRRKPLIGFDRLAWLGLLGGTIVMWLAGRIDGLADVSSLLGLCAAFAVYAGFYDRAR